MSNKQLKRIETHCDFCVVGGGLAGVFAAIAAARRGIKTVLIQDRPMLGGNCSSEIRMWIRGATQRYRKETGLISEFEQRNIYYNPDLNASMSDATLYAMAEENPLIDMYLNCSVMDMKKSKDKIISVTGWQTTTYTFVTVKARIFADCSGDSILAPLSGARYRVGREAKDEFGEELAQPVGDKNTMGLSVILSARETAAPVKFTPPPFANIYENDEDFEKAVSKSTGRLIRSHNIKNNDNLWWIELGGNMDSIHDADKVRRELLKCVYGVWDHIKNRGDHGMENFALDWVGFLPGKRESGRYEGDYMLTQHDLQNGVGFYDEVAYGGWPMDDHDPAGIASNAVSAARQIFLQEVYAIPYRCLYSLNVSNLMFAGRNISVSHVALSSSRVMGTCALLGQAVGEAAALALKHNTTPRGVLEYIGVLQQRLLEGGVYLPHVAITYGNLVSQARVNLSDDQKSALFSGIERPAKCYGENDISVNEGESIIFEWNEVRHIDSVRIVFDEGWDRDWVYGKIKKFAARLHRFCNDKPVEVYPGMIKSFAVFADGKKVFEDDDNYLALRKIPLNLEAKKLEIKWLKMRSGKTARIFAVDLR